MSTPPRQWLARVDFRPEVRLRLVCFAHAGGGAAPFFAWSDRLPATVALCPIRRPGRESTRDQPLLTEVQAIADGAVSALATLPARPTVLLGHSLGGAVALEVARRLEAAGQGPERLIVSAKHPPHLPATKPPIGGLPDPAFIDAVDARYGGIPAEIRREPELLALATPVLRADLQASESYLASVSPRLSCPLDVCYGVDDRAVDPSCLDRWGDLTEGTFSLERFPGGHFYLFKDPHFLTWLIRTLTRQTPRDDP